MKKTKEKNQIDSLLSYNFQYLIDVDYYRNSSNCECDGICRCSTIDNSRAKDVDMIGITDVFLDAFSKDEFTKYCVNRILVGCKLYDPDMWSISVSRGYYGEEVTGVFLDGKGNVKKWLKKLSECKTNRDRIFTALECEYGYVLDDIINIENWEIINVIRSSLNFGNKEHYRRLEKDVVKSYVEYNLPRAVCVKSGDVVRLVDGYHRLAATSKDTVRIVFGY